MQFAARTDFGSGSSPYGEALRGARAKPGFIDLTVSNPTVCGFAYPQEWAQALATPVAMRYDADPLGSIAARTAISQLYGEHYGAEVSTEHLLLTASTSEAYAYLLRLFCEPGDAILVPSPSYPLFDLLARLHDVQLIPYPLVYHDSWQIDASSLNAAITPRTRAIVAIHPNNPTGSYCHGADCDALFAACKQHSLPLIVDEVFLDYTVEGPATKSFAAMDLPVLTFVLGGLSKLLALPQMKLAWTAVCGPADEVTEAMARLEVIADTFLSVATPPQAALPAWLTGREAIQSQIKDRVNHNLRTLDQVIHGTVISRLRVEGAWSAVLRVPAIGTDTELAIRLLRDHAVAVHPGSFYGFPSQGWLVVSLLPQPDLLVQGIDRLRSAF